MYYVYNTEMQSKHMNINDLEEEYDRFEEESLMAGPSSRAVFTPGRSSSLASSQAYAGSQSARKDWAKIKVTLKQEKKTEGEELQKQKAVNKMRCAVMLKK
ncbi:uncharacterized protein LOC132712997 [Ruditapes philippinarum]|uniref:uncharacterized protein LOC132712997 n=1 Tax=Ruditapes philippinarum TaxID=129788 RepID=UPI00295B7DEC|nr:uncharacterized protein LOC132712997 [Ruditapes philippinarum]